VRADRLLVILSLLQVHRRMTSKELARRLEVSERTVHRDMEALSMAGVPVYAQRGVGGGWILEEPYRTDLTGLSEAEIRALFLAKPAHILADLGLHRAAEAGLAKLLASLPSMRRRDAEYVRQRIHVDVGGWQNRTEAVPALATVQDAVWQGRKLDMTYERSNGTSIERVVDPLGLVVKGTIWYLVAMVEGEARTYRVSRIHAARMTDEPTDRPEGFDLHETWRQQSDRFKESLPRYPVELLVHPARAPRVRSGVRYAVIEHEGTPRADGWVPFTVRFEVEREAAEYVLSLAPDVEVAEPVTLRETIVRRAEELLTRHRSNSIAASRHS
jgi:predicted DNA-binding transcriptional regulator YafY